MRVSANICIGPYELMERVGAGGMGEVYKAQDTRLHRTVALKILPESFARDAGRLRRFEQEARVLAALNHPNIVAIFDAGNQDSKPFLVTEFLSGKTLRERLNDGPVPVRKAVAYATEIAEALGAAHEKGIVHRDLKPENIFLTAEGRIKLLDFGLAHNSAFLARPDDGATLDSVQTEPGMVMGTVGYMSPEQVKGEAVDHRSDIFAFGAVFYEMLRGKRAFHGSSSVETMNAILKEEPPELLLEHPDLPPAVERILRHCLEKEPQRRFESASDLAFDLVSVSTLSDSSGKHTRALQPRRIGRAIALGIVMTAMIAAVSAVYYARRPSVPEFHKLTFQRGNVYNARFAPDGKTVLYSARWSGDPPEIFSTVKGSKEARPLDLLNAELLAISSRGELAVLLNSALQMMGFKHSGTLARVSMNGGTAPRPIAENIDGADWAPDGSQLAVLRRDSKTETDFVEFPVGKTIYRCEKPDWLTNLRFSPDGRLLAVLQHTGLNDDRGQLLVMDTTGNQKFRSAMWDGVFGLAWRSNRSLWVTATTPDNMARQLFQVDLNANIRRVAEVPGEVTVQDIASDGSALVTMNDRRILIAASRDGKWRDLSWLDRSIADTISADGITLLFHEGGQGAGSAGAIYTRKMDGSPPVRLSDGYGVDLSPDGKWVLALVPGSSPQFRLVPTGAGEPRSLSAPGIGQPQIVGFARNDSKLIWIGTGESNQRQVFVTDLDGSNWRAISPAGETQRFASLNGAFELRLTQHGLVLWDFGKNTEHSISTVKHDDIPLLLSTGGDWAYVAQVTSVPSLKIQRLHLLSGKRDGVAELSLPDLAGVMGMGRILITPDGRTVVVCYVRHLSELYEMQFHS